MSQNTNSNHITKNKKENLFDFHLNKPDDTCSQTQTVNNEFNLASCFANFFEKLTLKMTDIMSEVVGVASEKHA